MRRKGVKEFVGEEEGGTGGGDGVKGRVPYNGNAVGSGGLGGCKYEEQSGSKDQKREHINTYHDINNHYNRHTSTL